MLFDNSLISYFLCVCSATTIQKIKKPYIDSRARRNVSRLNEELADVQRIMVQNIDEVLQRGEHMSCECQ